MHHARMTEPTHPHPRRSRKRIVLIALAAMVVLASTLRWVSQPSQVAVLILDRVGATLGLQITASGTSQYRLRGTPMLVVRDLVARQSGAKNAVLTAERIELSLPWQTIRARGADLTVMRIELDAPHLDITALQAWQATRPPAETRIPTLTEGLKIVRGSIIGSGWSIEALDLSLPSLHPQQPVSARLSGRYLTGRRRVPFELDAVLTRPAADAGLGASGNITIETGSWRLPMQATLQGRLHGGDDGIGLDRFKFGATTRYVPDKSIAAKSDLPFVFGLAGRLRYNHGRFTIAPLGIAVRGQGVVPSFDAHGDFAQENRLAFRIQGLLSQWPEAWPALPPPIGQSTSPLPFVLDYAGRADLSDTTALQLRRDTTRFDGRFRWPAVLDWFDAGTDGTPLPPLDGTLSTPTLEISGATLDGVEIEFENPDPRDE